MSSRQKVVGETIYNFYATLILIKLTGRCVQKNYGYVGCSVDVTDDVASLCSSASCADGISPSLYSSRRPCPGDFTVWYLQVTYQCHPVSG